MRILFLTRKFPPSRGGMQRVAYELYTHLSRSAEVKLVKWGGSNRMLPVVLPWLVLKALWYLVANRVDVVYLQDGLLSPLGLVLKVFRKPVTATVHGRDITYNHWLYQGLIPPCLRRLDRIICISLATKGECLKRGVAEDRVVVIPNGVSEGLADGSGGSRKRAARQEFSTLLQDEHLAERKVILSVGRLVERKGFRWFIESVLPELLLKRKDWMYVIVGEGPQRGSIQASVTKKDLGERVQLLGAVSDARLALLYRAADVFVMPNIPVKGDMEGFGVVALEAASFGLPVVASNLEGISEAIKHGENGFLVKTYDTQGFVREISRLLAEDAHRTEFGARALEYTIGNYGWGKIAQSYLSLLYQG